MSLKSMNTPVFWAEGHPGKLDPKSWKLEVCGNCQNPHVYTWDELMKLPKSYSASRLTSVTRWSVYGTWGGILLKDLIALAQPFDTVRWVRFYSYRMIYDTSIPLTIAMSERSIMAHEFDSEELTEDYGAPIRAIIPSLWGYKSAKSVVKIELLDYYIPGFWELRGYTDSGKIEAGPCRDINDKGKIKQIGDGEVIEFV